MGLSHINRQTGGTGHSLTMVSDHYAVLFGGVEMEQRDNGVFKQQTCKDGELYILDLKRKNWSSLASTNQLFLFFFICCVNEKIIKRHQKEININIKNKNN